MSRTVIVGGVLALAVVTAIVVTQQRETPSHAGPTAGAVRTGATAAHPGVVAVPTTAPAAGVLGTASPSVASQVVVHRAGDPCAHNRVAQEAIVSLADQHMWVCARSRLHASYPVTTGRHTHGDVTPTGTFAIQARTRDTTLDPSGGGVFHVAYWLPFKEGVWGFHDAPWQTIPFGSPRYTTRGSSGCVHMIRSDIASFFRWVHLGAKVRIVAGPLT